MSVCCSSDEAIGVDLAVIGAGSAGFSAALTAAEQGARVGSRPSFGGESIAA